MAAPKSKTAATKGKVKLRKKEKKNVAVGQAYIKSTFNNTIISITDPTGAVISWSSSGQVGYKGSRKSTPFAAQLAAEAAANSGEPIQTKGVADRSKKQKIEHATAAEASITTEGNDPPRHTAAPMPTSRSNARETYFSR